MKEQFLKRMQSYLQEEYEDYLQTLKEEPYRGIRINLLKANASQIEETFLLRPSRFCKDGYYVEEKISGNHPYHLQGLFYMQEPSASSVISIAQIKENNWVLDLCSAPGGKSSQIAAELQSSGFLISNEYNNQRALTLLSNMERMGVCENMITNSDVTSLCKQLIGCMDVVVVDAPCSGEGMFKIHEKAMEDWSEEHVNACANRQLAILNDAYHTLKENGYLIYSTCTYAIEENEQVISQFLSAHSDMQLVDCNAQFGRQGFAYEGLDATKVCRIFPMDEGEGHFIAKLQRKSSNSSVKLKELKNQSLENFVLDFFMEQIGFVPPYIYVQNQKVYAKKTPFIKLGNVKILRQGVLCGEIVKNRFEPHHHFYMAAWFAPYFKKVVNIDYEQCLTFMSGNVLTLPAQKGYCALVYDNHVIGFGKSDGKQIKNKFPKGLRVK